MLFKFIVAQLFPIKGTTDKRSLSYPKSFLVNIENLELLDGSKNNLSNIYYCYKSTIIDKYAVFLPYIYTPHSVKYEILSVSIYPVSKN